MCVFQIKFVIYNNNNQNIITFSGWTVPNIKMAGNINVKGGMGSFVENHWPVSNPYSHIDFEFGTDTVIYILKNHIFINLNSIFPAKPPRRGGGRRTPPSQGVMVELK